VTRSLINSESIILTTLCILKCPVTSITVTTLSHVLFIRIMLMQVQSVLNKTEPNLCGYYIYRYSNCL